MAIVRYLDASGAPCIRAWLDDAERPEGAVEIDRLPGPFEDFVDGAWRYDAKGHADAIAGPEHVAEARLLKRIEAVLIVSGHALPFGLIAAESALRKVAPEELAALVLEKSAGFVATELKRQEPDIAKDATGDEAGVASAGTGAAEEVDLALAPPPARPPSEGSKG